VIVDDIPVARRSRSPQPPRNGLFAFMGIGSAGLLLALAGALIWPGPLRSLLAPPPVAGLAVRPGPDGRLLGHFPYPAVDRAQLLAVAPGQQLHRDAADALLTMQNAALADGVNLVVLSGFRSVDEQKALFFDVKAERNQSAGERAKVSAPPGYSEHSTGYAVDLGDAAAPGTNLSQAFETTAAFAWLRSYAHQYQFTISFPKGNPQGVNYEPWHWRFEGTAEALRIFEPANRLQPR
jgi:D-alanyl-D-alanine carboxypeptidase